MAETYGQDSTALTRDSILIGGPAHTEAVLLSAGEGTLAAGTVLGLKTKDTIAVAVDDGNTGDADLSALAVTLGAQALPGTYTLTCTAESGNAGTFSVLAPNGFYLPDLTVAAAYAGDHLNLTLPDGATDWATGDVVTITVSGSGEAAAYDAAAVDGTQVAARILADQVVVDDSVDTPAVAYRTGVFRRALLTGISDAAAAQLDAAGLLVR